LEQVCVNFWHNVTKSKRGAGPKYSMWVTEKIPSSPLRSSGLIFHVSLYVWMTEFSVTNIQISPASRLAFSTVQVYLLTQYKPGLHMLIRKIYY
jgi:hypothetical protein